jgi:hypothetical protein
MLGITRRAAVLAAAADGHPARLFKGGEPGFCLPSVAEALRSGALLKDYAANLAVVGDAIHSIYNATSEIEVAPSAVAFAGESYQVSPGVYRVLSTAGVYSEVVFTVPASTYRVTFTVSDRVSGSPTVTNGTNDIGIPTGAGQFSRVINRAATVGIKRTSPSGATDLIISNVRFFRQVAGVGAQQFTATKRPLLTADSRGIPLLRFDGIDDCLVTPSIDFSVCDAVTVIAGIRKNAGTTVAAVCEHGVVSSPGAFGLFAPVDSSNSGNHVYMQTRGGADGGWYYDIPAGSSSVFASVLVGSATTRAEKAPTYVLNGNSLSVRYAGGAADPIGSGPFQNAALNIGQRNASVYAFSGDLYSLTVIGRRLSNAEMLATSRWINEQMGRVY